jgi:translation elongation factor EF-Ts
MMEIGDTKKTVAGMEQKKESLKKWLNDCKTATEAMKNGGGQPSTQEQEENVFTESIILLD